MGTKQPQGDFVCFIPLNLRAKSEFCFIIHDLLYVKNSLLIVSYLIWFSNLGSVSVMKSPLAVYLNSVGKALRFSEPMKGVQTLYSAID